MKLILKKAQKEFGEIYEDLANNYKAYLYRNVRKDGYVQFNIALKFPYSETLSRVIDSLTMENFPFSSIIDEFEIVNNPTESKDIVISFTIKAEGSLWSMKSDAHLRKDYDLTHLDLFKHSRNAYTERELKDPYFIKKIERIEKYNNELDKNAKKERSFRTSAEEGVKKFFKEIKERLGNFREFEKEVELPPSKIEEAPPTQKRMQNVSKYISQYKGYPEKPLGEAALSLEEEEEKAPETLRSLAYINSLLNKYKRILKNAKF